MMLTGDCLEILPTLEAESVEPDEGEGGMNDMACTSTGIDENDHFRDTTKVMVVG